MLLGDVVDVIRRCCRCYSEML